MLELYNDIHVEAIYVSLTYVSLTFISVLELCNYIEAMFVFCGLRE